MTKRQIDRKYGRYTAAYTLCKNKQKCRDAYKTTDCATRYSNDARNKRLTNAKFIDFKLKANKGIKPNEEIFTHYGKGYWKYLNSLHQPNVTWFISFLVISAVFTRVDYIVSCGCFIRVGVVIVATPVALKDLYIVFFINIQQNTNRQFFIHLFNIFTRI